MSYALVRRNAVEQLNLLTQLRTRADRATSLETENRDLRQRIEALESVDVGLLLYHLGAVLSTAPVFSARGRIEWMPNGAPGTFNAACDAAAKYITPPDLEANDGSRMEVQHPERFNETLLRARVRRRAKAVLETEGGAQFIEQFPFLLEAVEDYERVTSERLLDERIETQRRADDAA
jgi:hypothetical protein